MNLFSLQKTLAYLIMPAGLVWLLLLGMALLCWRRKLRGTAVGVLVLALLFACAGNIRVGATLMEKLERTIPPTDFATLQPFDAVCVLGGGTDVGPAGQVQLSASGDRVYVAAKLWHAGKARLLVASGSAPLANHGIRDCGADTRTLWLNMGVPDHAILVVQEPCWITRDEIAAYRKLQDRFGWQRLGLVSSAAHLPRALGLAAKAGLVMTPVGADWLGRRRVFQFQDLVPQADGFTCTQRACWEWVGRKMGR